MAGTGWIISALYGQGTTFNEGRDMIPPDRECTRPRARRHPVALDFRGGEPWPVVYFDTPNIDLEDTPDG